MGNSQKGGIQNYRTRLGERGLVGFEVLGREADRDFTRSLARGRDPVDRRGAVPDGCRSRGAVEVSGSWGQSRSTAVS